MATLNRTPRSITAAQRQRLFGLAKRKGLDTEALRGLAGGSISALSAAQASDLIARMGQPLPNQPGQAPSPYSGKPAAGSTRIITQAHEQQIERMLCDQFGDLARGLAWLTKNFSAPTVRDLNTAQRAGEVIRTLKEMRDRTSRQ